jgi:uncharacterized protein YbjT (DUF2867 family)
MRVVLFGASGMVGQGVLIECLRDPGVAEVIAVVRSPLDRSDPKLRVVVVPNVGELTAHEAELRGLDACFWCLGVSSVGKSEAEYRRVTYDLTLAAATSLAAWNPAMTFVYVSGAGTDSTEHGSSMWARVKGATENALARLPFRSVYWFRPGIIQARHGVRSRTRGYRIAYAVLFPFLLLVRAVAPNSVTSTDRVGRAMLAVVRQGPSGHVIGSREINALAA